MFSNHFYFLKVRQDATLWIKHAANELSWLQCSDTTSLCELFCIVFKQFNTEKLVIVLGHVRHICILSPCRAAQMTEEYSQLYRRTKEDQLEKGTLTPVTVFSCPLYECRLKCWPGLCVWIETIFWNAMTHVFSLMHQVGLMVTTAVECFQG